MFKKSVLVFISLGLLLSLAYAEDSYTISGNVIPQYEGDIYVCLFTVDNWIDFQTPGHKLSQKECHVTKWNDDVKKAGKISFSFENVPKGTYSIIAYQDVNNNGEVDYEGLETKEPWQSFRERDPVINYSSWDQVSFDLKEDMKGIEIHM